MKGIMILTMLALTWAGASRVCAHCDTMDGPVIAEARVALEKGDIAPVLKWVEEGRRAELRAAFEQTLAVRKQGAEAKALADRLFLRDAGAHPPGRRGRAVHRSQAGRCGRAADRRRRKALATGNLDELAKEVADATAAGLRQRFDRALDARKHAGHDVAAGREYVETYVEFVHYVERLHEAARSPAHAGPGAAKASRGHQH